MRTYSTRLISMFMLALATSALLTFWLADLEALKPYVPFTLEWTGSSVVLFSFYFFLVFDLLILAIETSSPSYHQKKPD